MLEHETHPAGSDFCSCTCTHPCPMTPSLPGAAGCSLAASPQPHGAFPTPSLQRSPDGQGKERAQLSREQFQQPFHGGLFCRSHQAHASSPGASRAPRHSLTPMPPAATRQHHRAARAGFGWRSQCSARPRSEEEALKSTVREPTAKQVRRWWHFMEIRSYLPCLKKSFAHGACTM